MEITAAAFTLAAYDSKEGSKMKTTLSLLLYAITVHRFLGFCGYIFPLSLNAPLPAR
jgi:hypothetical protein